MFYMGIESAGSSGVDAKFLYENFSEKIQTAIDTLTNKILETNPINKTQTAEFFRVPESLLQSRHVEYFEAYARIAVRQLVIGSFYGPHHNLASLDIDKQVHVLEAGQSSRLFTDRRVMHDIAHTIVALGRTGGESPTQLIPDFQRKSENSADYSSPKERDAAVKGMFLDERLAAFWSPFITSRTSVLYYIERAKEQTKNEDGSLNLERAEESFIEFFLDHPYLAGVTDDFSKNMASRIFHEYEKDEMLTFKIFLEVTQPLMKREVPKIGKLF